MFPRTPLRLLGRSLPLTVSALSLACSDAAVRPLAPALPSTPNLDVIPIVVTNTADAGPGSLRQAIEDVADGSSIRFADAIAGQKIVLTSQLFIVRHVTIEGPASAGMTISGGLTSRVFEIESERNVTLRNLAIVDGRDDEGAGILSKGDLTLDHSLVANNEVVPGTGVARGGGIASVSSGQLTLLNTTVSGNYATYGGGIYNEGGPLTLRNSTVAFNGAESGGGLYGGGFLSIRNTIISNNADAGTNVPSSADCDLVTPATFTGANIGGASCGTSPALLVVDPKLRPLADNGGPTKTHALDLTSPAIDLGSQCTEATDQRYVTRNQGTSCDVGAYEFDGYTRVTLTVDPNASVTKAGVATVSGTIICATPGSVVLNVALSQTQKTTGRFTTIVQASGQTTVACAGTSSWSVVLTAQTGAFSNGSATSTVETTTVPTGFLAASATSPVKLFQVPK